MSQPYTSAGIISDYFPNRPFVVYFSRESEAYKKHESWLVGYLESMSAEDFLALKAKTNEDFEVTFRITATASRSYPIGEHELTTFRGSEVVRIEARNR